MTDRKLLQQALDALEFPHDSEWSNKAKAIEALQKALAQPDKPLRLSPVSEYGHIHEFYPDWDMIQPFHERIKELEIELAKFAPVGEIRSSVWAGHNWAHHFNAEQKLDFKTKLYIKLEHENE